MGTKAQRGAPDRRDPGKSSGRVRQRLRTKRQLLSAAVAMIAAGQTPSVTEVADAAGVSRRTAYRYFPAQTKLLTEAALEGIRPRMELALGSSAQLERADVGARIDALVESMLREALANETLLRTMVHATVLERTPPDTPRRGLRRIDWIESATKPLRGRLGPAGYARLVSALAVCVGIEPLLVLKDIRGLSARRAIATSRWMARAVLRQSLEETEAPDRE